ncbi:PP2C family protein-serine/threonine phosphatase [Streptacidiphilus neutrinimicus]|uniref:PP2C family protein-serine/threonine phosphatase n=1 Tax=Streptacidiphilus neutrinimicus TaxID=105420 RepID=UPI001EED19F9|nr:PP2C family protein-serine/threonine phosphatase [Streptacidiphilus neutrinimicus]
MRAALSHALAAAGTPTPERLRLLTEMTAHLGGALDQTAVHQVSVHPGPSGSGTTRSEQRLTVRCAAPSADRLAWERTVPCRDPQAGLLAAATGTAAGDLDAALVGAERDVAELLAHLDEQSELIRSHREELHHTNQGVLALHAELDTAAREQRRLLSAERAARAQAEEARRRLVFLTDTSAALAASLSHDAIITSLQDLLVPAYARAAEVWLPDDGELLGGRRNRAAVTGPDAVTGREPAPLRLPLTARRTTIGVLSLVPVGEAFAADDITMLRELAHRTAVALDNALRYERHRDTAETLQRALLTDLPDTRAVRLAARYLPATRGLNIGGDWYDAFTLPDGSVTLVVGDVTGHGLRAAVMMGQLRTALRAYAVAGDGPGTLLAKLHAFIHHLDQELYATAVVARIQPGEPTVTWAAAGHPPPLLLGPGDHVRLLEEKSGPMLGLPLQRPFEEYTAPFPPGSTFLLYTDGLVERRAEGIDLGIDRLGRALAALDVSGLSDGLEDAADLLLTPMLADHEGEDDVCLLLCHAPQLP